MTKSHDKETQKLLTQNAIHELINSFNYHTDHSHWDKAIECMEQLTKFPSFSKDDRNNLINSSGYEGLKKWASKKQEEKINVLISKNTANLDDSKMQELLVETSVKELINSFNYHTDHSHWDKAIECMEQLTKFPSFSKDDRNNLINSSGYEGLKKWASKKQEEKINVLISKNTANLDDSKMQELLVETSVKELINSFNYHTDHSHWDKAIECMEQLTKFPSFTLQDRYDLVHDEGYKSLNKWVNDEKKNKVEKLMSRDIDFKKEMIPTNSDIEKWILKHPKLRENYLNPETNPKLEVHAKLFDYLMDKQGQFNEKETDKVIKFLETKLNPSSQMENAEIILEIAKNIPQEKKFDNLRNNFEELYNKKVLGIENNQTPMENKFKNFDKMVEEVGGPTNLGKLIYRKNYKDKGAQNLIKDQYKSKFEKAVSLLQTSLDQKGVKVSDEDKEKVVKNAIKNCSFKTISNIVKATDAYTNYSQKNWLSKAVTRFVDCVCRTFSKAKENVKVGIKEFMINNGATIKEKVVSKNQPKMKPKKEQRRRF